MWSTLADNGGNEVVDENNNPAGFEVDPIYQAEKSKYLKIAETSLWDKNALDDLTNANTVNWDKDQSDDFDGDYNKLHNKPTQLSEFTNDLNLTIADILPSGFGIVDQNQTSSGTCPAGLIREVVHYNVGNTNNAFIAICKKP